MSWILLAKICILVTVIGLISDFVITDIIKEWRKARR